MAGGAESWREKEKLLALVVHSVTGVQPGTTNFKLCLDFAQSQLKHHRFLEPNEKEVPRRFAALAEKFEIHAQDDRAQRLNELLAELSAHDMRQGEAYDIKASVLTLLLALAETPTNSSYDSAEHVVAEQAPVSEINWRKILWDIAHEDDDLEEHADETNSTTSEHLNDLLDDERWMLEPSKQKDTKTLRRALVRADTPDTDWSSIEVAPDEAVTHLAKSQFWARTEDAQVNEIHVIREVLFMLRGCEGPLFRIRSEADQFVLRMDVWTTTLGSGAMGACLRRWIDCANNAMTLRKFSTAADNPESRAVCAVRLAVRQVVELFDRGLATEETRHNVIGVRKANEDVIWSLLHMEEHLRQQVDTVARFAQLLQHRWLDQPRSSRLCERLASLYTAWYNEAVVAEQLGDSQAPLWWSTFSTCFQPYAEVLDQWARLGSYSDRDESTFLGLYLVKEATSPSGFRVVPNADDYDVAVPVFLQQLASTIVTAGMTAGLARAMPRHTNVAAISSISQAWISALPHAPIHHAINKDEQQLDGAQADEEESDLWLPPRSDVAVRGKSAFDELLAPLLALAKPVQATQEFFGDPFRSFTSEDKSLAVTGTLAVPPAAKVRLSQWLQEQVWLPPLRDGIAQRSAQVLKQLMGEGGLWQLLQTMHAVYLHRAALAMDLFLSESNAAMMRTTDGDQLAAQLRLCLQQHPMPMTTSDLDVDLISTTNRTRPSSYIRIAFKISAAAQFVLRTRHLELYERISEFLQSITYAIAALNISRPRSDNDSRQPNRIWLQRMRVLTFANAIARYVTTDIIAAALAGWHQTLLQPDLTLERLTDEHERFLNHIAKGCFLVDTDETMRDAILAVLRATDSESIESAIQKHLPLILSWLERQSLLPNFKCDGLLLALQRE